MNRYRKVVPIPTADKIHKKTRLYLTRSCFRLSRLVLIARPIELEMNPATSRYKRCLIGVKFQSVRSGKVSCLTEVGVFVFASNRHNTMVARMMTVTMLNSMRETDRKSFPFLLSLLLGWVSKRCAS
jgi:hypothetical protein